MVDSAHAAPGAQPTSASPAMPQANAVHSENPEMLTIEICYATPTAQFLRAYQITPGTTLLQAVQQSEVLQQFPEIDVSTCRVGIYGKLKTLETVLRQHDRVEIYRPLVADPKDARRHRAKKK